MRGRCLEAKVEGLIFWGVGGVVVVGEGADATYGVKQNLTIIDPSVVGLRLFVSSDCESKFTIQKQTTVLFVCLFVRFSP